MTNPQRTTMPFAGRPGTGPSIGSPSAGSPSPGRGTGGAGQSRGTQPAELDDVPVHTQVWCSVVMVPLASFMCMAQTSFFSQNFDQNSAGFLLMILCLLVAMPSGFLLLARSEYPEPTFWIACALVALLPYDSLIVLMAMSALLARRSDRRTGIRAVAAGTLVTVWSQVRDAIQPPNASLWHVVFAKPRTNTEEEPIVMLAEEPTIVITAVVTALVASAIAVFVGLHIRSRARLRTANAVASAATDHAATLQTDLNNQQLADAIAAEAHDTLAHSLSLMALNASALKAEADRLGDSPEAHALASKAEDIRRQSAGALDEAHAIIDMLRNPQQAWEQLAPSDDTSLTRESLDALIADARNSGTQLNTWIDIQQLSGLDETIGKVAYRAIQEGLTNARRHAPGAPVSLEVTAGPAAGVHLHLSNPMTQLEGEVPDTARPGTMPPASIPIRTLIPVPTALSGAPTSASSSASAAMSGAVSTPDGRRAAPYHDGSVSSHTASHTVPRAADRPTHGAGLPGLAARARSVGGQCRYGMDDRHLFHVDVQLPWRG